MTPFSGFGCANLSRLDPLAVVFVDDPNQMSIDTILDVGQLVFACICCRRLVSPGGGLELGAMLNTDANSGPTRLAVVGWCDECCREFPDRGVRLDISMDLLGAPFDAASAYLKPEQRQ